jgi:hypothetical protein
LVHRHWYPAATAAGSVATAADCTKCQAQIDELTKKHSDELQNQGNRWREYHANDQKRLDDECTTVKRGLRAEMADMETTYNAALAASPDKAQLLNLQKDLDRSERERGDCSDKLNKANMIQQQDLVRYDALQGERDSLQAAKIKSEHTLRNEINRIMAEYNGKVPSNLQPNNDKLSEGEKKIMRDNGKKLTDIYAAINNPATANNDREILVGYLETFTDPGKARRLLNLTGNAADATGNVLVNGVSITKNAFADAYTKAVEVVTSTLNATVQTAKDAATRVGGADTALKNAAAAATPGSSTPGTPGS